MQKSPRRSARKLLLVLALLLGIVTLSGCVASAPVTTSDPVGVGLGVTVRQLENVPLVITVKNNMDKFVSDIRVEIVAVDGKPGIAPFALWETPDASGVLLKSCSYRSGSAGKTAVRRRLSAPCFLASSATRATIESAPTAKPVQIRISP